MVAGVDVQPVSVGRIVHYVMQDGQHRPAIVVRLWPSPTADPVVNLQVFTDGDNDHLENVVWRTSVLHSADPKPGTWHWPEKV